MVWTEPAHAVDCLTFHGDNARLGWNARETALSPATVKPGSFGKLWWRMLDGEVHGSPLVVSGMAIRGGKADVVYALTDGNSVYALDAATGAILWTRRKLAPPLTATEFRGMWGWDRQFGAASTPVIDRHSGTIYVGFIRENGLRQISQLWALDLHTGKDRPGWPVTLAGTDRGCAFNAGHLNQRGALTLVDGWVYAVFGGRADTPPWRGWVIGVNTRDPAERQRAFTSSPHTDGAGIWSAGGLSAGPNGDLFAVTGNGEVDLGEDEDSLNQAVLRLTTSGGALRFVKQPVDYYRPSNYKDLDEQDEDLGGATAIVLPDQPGTSTPHVLFTGGKGGVAYLMNRDNLGGVGGELWQARLYGDVNAVYHEAIRSTAAYFDAGDAGRFIYVPGEQRGPDGELGLTALKVKTDAPGGPARLERAWTLHHWDGVSASPAVSSNGASDGIVWIVEILGDGRSALHAFDAVSGDSLYDSGKAPAVDRLVRGQKFTSPVIADGRVFVGAGSWGVVCYGRLPGQERSGR
jgi:outer membrane protein assembly factor BamB